MEPRDARAEAGAAVEAALAAEPRAGSSDLGARVLEPSPPTIHDGDHYADDPVAVSGDGPVVVPVDRDESWATSWSALAASHPVLATFAAERWLGAYRPLGSLPDSFASTRHSLWRLAVHVVYRSRRAANGKYGLRWTLGGFGTPFFGEDEQVRVSGGALVRQRARDVAVEPITSLRRAADFVGVDFDAGFDHGFRDVVDVGDADEDLDVDPRAALALGEWFGFATSVLEQVRHDRSRVDPSRVQLWPEHFDLAIDLAFGAGAAGQRVNVGASPGDDGATDPSQSGPYLYVGPWTSDRPGPDDGYWNADFGAVLGYEEIRAVGDGDAQRSRSLAFIYEGLDRLDRG